MEKEEIEKIEQEIKKATDDGPTFGQSHFQTYSFNINKHTTKARQYRQILLELSQKTIALKTARITRKKLNAEISVLKKKFDKTDDIDKKTIVECKIESKQLALEIEEKLIADAIKECNFLYDQFKQYKHVTDEEFEKEELQYWKARLEIDAQLSVLSTGRIDIGTALSLAQIGINPVKLQLEALQLQEAEMKTLIEEKAKQLEKPKD
jgi:hypothetical protein